MTRHNDNIGNALNLERSNARVLIGMLIISIILLASIVFHFSMISEKDELIRQLSADRIMYGVLSDDGRYFESVKDIPVNIVKDFSRSFIIDWANYTPETIEENRTSAMKKMSIEFKRLVKRQANTETRFLKSKFFSQQFIPTKYEMTEDEVDSRKLNITITGVVKRWQNDNLTSDNSRGTKTEFKISVEKRAPTESHPQGLAIVNLQQPKLTDIK